MLHNDSEGIYCDYICMKYLYHGSPIRNEILAPHQRIKASSSNDQLHAVYATHIKEIAIIFALGIEPMENGLRLGRRMKEKMIFINCRPRQQGKGYLYKLDANEFKQIDERQWISEKPVTPLEIIEIDVQDYDHLWRFPEDGEF